MAGFIPAALAVAAIDDASNSVFVALAGTAAISLLGLIDDLRPQPAWRRLLVHVLAAAMVVGSSWSNLPAAWTLFGIATPHWALGILSVLWIAWWTNLYNFMDGIDGLAGGQAVVAFGALAIVGYSGGAAVSSTLALILLASSLGFLFFNFPPATIFMGDVGSTSIGFLLGSLPLVSPGGAIPVEAAGLAAALFFLDATWTLLRRMFKRERLSQAHRSHVYQRPLALGVSHRTITLTAYAGMLVVGACSITYRDCHTLGRLSLLTAAILVFGLFAVLVERLERHFHSNGPASP